MGCPRAGQTDRGRGEAGSKQKQARERERGREREEKRERGRGRKKERHERHRKASAKEGGGVGVGCRKPGTAEVRVIHRLSPPTGFRFGGGVCATFRYFRRALCQVPDRGEAAGGRGLYGAPIELSRHGPAMRVRAEPAPARAAPAGRDKGGGGSSPGSTGVRSTCNVHTLQRYSAGTAYSLLRTGTLPLIVLWACCWLLRRNTIHRHCYCGRPGPGIGIRRTATHSLAASDDGTESNERASDAARGFCAPPAIACAVLRTG